MTQNPSPQRLSSTTLYTKRVRPTAYTVAVYLVGAIALLELAMIVSVFWLRAMVVSVNTQAPRPRVEPANTKPVTPQFVGPIEPKPTLPNLGPVLPRLPGLDKTPTVQPALLSVPAISSKLEQVGTLNDEAQILLHQNDLKNAAQVLITAEDLDPRNPTTLKSLAETYYLLNNSVRARNYWQRLADLGPGVGTVYAQAKDHVLLLDSTPDANTLAEPSPLPRAAYIDLVEKTPIETANGQPHFHLRVSLRRKRPDAPFDQKKLQVYVIFYQEMPDGRLLPDLTQRKGAFEDTFLFWNNKQTEPFSVDYIMPTPGAPGTNSEGIGDYYGFVIGIYYNKVLQDSHSEPTDLAKRISLPSEIE